MEKFHISYKGEKFTVLNVGTGKIVHSAEKTIYANSLTQAKRLATAFANQFNVDEISIAKPVDKWVDIQVAHRQRVDGSWQPWGK